MNLLEKHRPKLVRRGVRQRAAALFERIEPAGELHVREKPERRPRLAVSAVYEIPALQRTGRMRAATRNWRASALYQA